MEKSNKELMKKITILSLFEIILTIVFWFLFFYTLVCILNKDINTMSYICIVFIIFDIIIQLQLKKRKSKYKKIIIDKEEKDEPTFEEMEQ